MKHIFKILTIIIVVLTSTFSQSSALVPLAGNYTIDATQPASGTNFPSFNDFASAINLNGISAPVTVTVASGSGPYNEQVVINPVTGSSPANIVTINGNGEILHSTTNTNDRHALRLKGVSYFNITNLSIERDTTSSSGFYGIQLLDSARHVSITNCNITISGTTSTLTGSIVASGSETSILDPGSFHDIYIASNTVTGGGYGVSLYGEGNNLATNVVITQNTIYDFHSNGIYLRESNGTIVSSNTLDKRTQNITSANAIQVAQAANINVQIFNNVIHVSQTNNGSSTLRGIYLFDGSGHKVFNNVINDVRLTSGNFTAIEIRSGGTSPQISFNTIALDNTAGSTGDLIAIAEELSNTNSILRNNNISISQSTTGLKCGLLIGAVATPATAFNSNYNNIFITGNGHIAAKGSLTPVFYTTMSSWNTASNQDLNSVQTNPLFFSSTLSIPTNTVLDNKGISISGITTDIAGTPRASIPDIGAYEFGTTSVSEASLNPYTIYPNPVTDYLNITDLSVRMIDIYNEAGQLVKKITLHSQDRSVNISELPDGFYQMLFYSEEKTYISRVIKRQ